MHGQETDVVHVGEHRKVRTSLPVERQDDASKVSPGVVVVSSCRRVSIFS